jgi:hypothetical protein
MDKEIKKQLGDLLVKTVQNALKVDRAWRDVPVVGKVMADVAIASHLIAAADQIRRIEEKTAVDVNIVMKDGASSLFDVVLDEHGVPRPEKEDVN